MFDLRKIPMVRVLIPFFGGVVAGFHSDSEIRFWWMAFLLFSLWGAALAVFLWQGRKPGMLPGLLSPVLCLLFFILGAGNGNYIRPSDPGFPEDQRVLVRGELTGKPQAGSFEYAFDLEVHLLCSSDSIYRSNTYLKCYMSMPADSLLPAPGEIWQFSGRLAGIRSNGNPGSPDYRAIMGRKNTWYRFYISAGLSDTAYHREVAVGKLRMNPLLIRQKVSDHWQGDRDEVSLLKAVCLGDRSSLTDDMRQAYQAAGGMHLLAVSGLHVGLIWWVLQYMTGWMRILFRGRKQQTVLVVGLLWFYAFLTGFSSSVCRSVTMFSFFSASRLMGKRSPPLNVILASAFLLVLIEPQRLMDLGFQLSYAAITGIVVLHPLILGRVAVKNRVLRRVWEATSVSMAAQLATAPLVIYYFHQLPVYSILTSLVAVPLLSLLIAIFICSVPFISAGILESFSSSLLLGLARLMNLSMEYFASLPGAVLDGLQLSPFNLLLWILMLLLTMIALYCSRRLPWYLLSVLFATLLLGNALSSLKCRTSSELVIAHFRGASMVSIREGVRVDHFCWYIDSTSIEYMNTYRENAWNRRRYDNRLHVLSSEGKKAEEASACKKLVEGAWLLGGQQFRGLVLQAPLPACSWLQSYEPDFVLLSGEPPVEGLQNMCGSGQAVLVIDGSNRNWYGQRLAAEFDQIYLTDRSGAYMKRW